ncbi:MAG: hypothetical protein EAZ67_11385 [Cytophagales bacterium]|nr:MAG: hypothetical protein EAZ67_11385 [Cytophagales bacterium]
MKKFQVTCLILACLLTGGGGNLLAQKFCGSELDSATYAAMRQEMLDMMKNKRTLSNCTDPYYDCPDDQ